MNVSWRNMLAGAGALALGAGATWACCTPPGHQIQVPPIVVQPPIIGSNPGSGPGTGPGCCGPVEHRVLVPNVGVGVPGVLVPQVPVISGVVGGGVLSSGIVAQSGFNQNIIAGGSAFFEPTSVAPSFIEFGGETTTEMRTVTEEVPSTEETCVDEVRETVEVRAIQAVCIDDKGTPHPASQVFPERSIAGDYSGEVFRCLAGATMQVTIADSADVSPTFSAGRSFSCAKGDALTHQPGGQLVCAPQAPERDCNERSLLRKYGPGIKTVSLRTSAKTCVPTTRTVMKTVTRQVKVEVPTANVGRMDLDGGVGQGVF